MWGGGGGGGYKTVSLCKCECFGLFCFVRSCVTFKSPDGRGVQGVAVDSLISFTTTTRVRNLAGACGKVASDLQPLTTGQQTN